MRFKKFFLTSFILILLTTLVFTPIIQASTSNEGGQFFTKEQLKDIEKAKKRTEKLQKEWDKRTEKVKYQDKKVVKSTTSKAAVSDNLYVTSTYTGRPGVFYVTLDGTSSSLTWAGGHAGMVYDAYNVVESFGNQKESSSNGVHFWPNDWTTRYNHFEARTTYGTTLEEDRLAAVKAASYLGKPYNYNFFYINQDNSFYCSQLVWYSFDKLYGIDLNDGWAVWPVDLTESPNAYLIYSQ